MVIDIQTISPDIHASFLSSLYSVWTYELSLTILNVVLREVSTSMLQPQLYQMCVCSIQWDVGGKCHP